MEINPFTPADGTKQNVSWTGNVKSDKIYKLWDIIFPDRKIKGEFYYVRTFKICQHQTQKGKE